MNPIIDPTSTRPAGFGRRHALGLGVAAAAAAVVPAATRPAHADPTADPTADTTADPTSRSVTELEQQHDLTIGLYAANLASGRDLRHRADERFAICSVFKMVAVAAVLRDVACSGSALDRRVRYSRADLVDGSPITGPRVAAGMTVGELCDAALRYSDNTAGNLLLELIGGPAGVTRFARSVGDRRTRLDRWETELNIAIPGDLRDTTTPSAIGRTCVRLLTGPVLSTPDRWLLRAWMQGNTTSATRFRAGLPADWTLADKTGGGGYASNNDVGIAWAPDGTPLLIAAMTRADDPDRVTDNAVMVDLARLAVARLT